MIRIEEAVYNHYEKATQLSYSFNFEDITFYQLQGEMAFKTYFLNRYLLLYTEQGVLDVYIDEKKIRLSSKDLLLVPPYHVLKQAAENADTETRLYSAEFSCSQFKFFEIGHHVHISNAAGIEPLLSELYNTFMLQEGHYYQDAQLLLIIRLIKKLAFGYGEQQQLAERIRTYILQHLMQPLNIPDISEALNYNKDYLCRIFKKEYGVSIKEYLNKEKIELSKRLLQTSELSITAIAKMLGWDEMNLFVKFFKYHEGTTPSQYRQNTIR